MKDLLIFTGGGITFLGIGLYCLAHFDKIQLFIGTLLRPLSFFRWIRQKGFALSLQGRLNETCNSVAPDVFQKRLRVRWLKKGDIHEIFATGSDDEDEIMVHVVHKSNPHDTLVSILQQYTSISFVPNLRPALDRSFIVANELYIMSNIIDKNKNDALRVYYDDYARRAYDDATTGLLQTIHSLDKRGLYFQCFLNTLASVDEKVRQYTLDEEVQHEVSNLINFFHSIAQKKTDAEAELLFKGHLFKLAIVLVAKKETLQSAGLDAHIERVKLVAKQDVDRIYITGTGYDNIINVKRLAAHLRRIRWLNGLAPQIYEIESPSGRQVQRAIAVYENYYYKQAEIEKSQREEVEALLNAHISEIRDGWIEVINVVREKGIVTKVLVKTDSEDLNVIGCCLGRDCERRNLIESALVKEHVHFVEYSEDPETLVRRSLFPCPEEMIIECNLSTEKKAAQVRVQKEYIGLAIGKRGHNVKLASQLTEWYIQLSEKSGSSEGR